MKDSIATRYLIDLSDLANATGGDFHLMHLNFRGDEFDTFHKHTLKEYYEECADDYDSLAEFACCFEAYVPNPNESAKRIDFSSKKEGKISRKEAVDASAQILKDYLEAMHGTYQFFNKRDDCPVSVGIANWLQGRLEFWSKELCYFNERRSA